MRTRWLGDLVDPVTGAPLELTIDAEHGEHVVEGMLRGPDGRAWPIAAGVPRFVDGDASQTGKSFGDKWTDDVYREFGRDEADRQRRIDRLAPMLGVAPDGLRAHFSGAKRVLDAGCGMGWLESVYNPDPDTARFAVDLSRAVGAAFVRTRDLENVCVVQADVARLPFRHDFFDTIVSEGVLHHTPDPRGAFDALCCHLAPGGRLGIYIYCHKPRLREMADREIRAETTEMDFESCREFSEGMAKLGRSLAAIEGELEIEQAIPLLGIEAGRYPLQRFVYDHLVKCFWNESIGLERSILNNVDWYHPRWASHHSREEIEGWFADNGFVDVRIVQPEGWRHSGWFASGTRPMG